MRILLQNFETGLYLCADGRWTDDPAKARAFPNTVQATGFMLNQRLRCTFVVVLPIAPTSVLPLAGPTDDCRRVLPSSRRPPREGGSGKSRLFRTV